jgi:hypothetical protein
MVIPFILGMFIGAGLAFIFACVFLGSERIE